MDSTQLTQLFTQLWQFASQHKWIPLLAIVIGLVVRLLKSDTKIPIDIPSRLRTPLVYALGIATVVLEKVGAGTSWQTALIDGMVSALVAQQGHLLIVDSIRGGKELVIPGLIKPNTPPGPGKPPSIPPTAANIETMRNALLPPNDNVGSGGSLPSIESTPIMGDPSKNRRWMIPSFMPMFIRCAVLAIFIVVLSSCALFNSKNLPSTELAFEQIACIIEHAFVDDRTLNNICNIIGDAQQAEAKRVAASHRASVTRALSSQRTSSCDGGSDVILDSGKPDGSK